MAAWRQLAGVQNTDAPDLALLLGEGGERRAEQSSRGNQEPSTSNLTQQSSKTNRKSLTDSSRYSLHLRALQISANGQWACIGLL